MKYFDITDFDSPDEPGSGKRMDENFLKMLDQAREYAGCAIVVNSGVRSIMHNTKVGGKKNSSHLSGHAADISVLSSRRRHHILTGLMKAGFTRIGIGSNFIHVDNDPKKDPCVIWTY